MNAATQVPGTTTLIGLLAGHLLDLFADEERVYHYQADPKAQPLIEALKVQGTIPKDATPVVEWSGVMEFKLVPLCWFEGDTQRWANIYRDGKIEEF